MIFSRNRLWLGFVGLLASGAVCDAFRAGAGQPPSLVDALKVELNNTIEGRIQDILLLGYVFGEEMRAVTLASEVAARYDDLRALVPTDDQTPRPRVLALTSYGSSIFTAGAGSTEGLIIEASGGLNVAAAAGLSANPTISLEGLVAMSPEVIIIPQPSPSAERFRDELLSNRTIALVPAIREGRVYSVAPNYFTTLSFWNIRGAEELARLLWPQRLGGRIWSTFSFPDSEETP